MATNAYLTIPGLPPGDADPSPAALAPAVLLADYSFEVAPPMVNRSTSPSLNVTLEYPAAEVPLLVDLLRGTPISAVTLSVVPDGYPAGSYLFAAEFTRASVQQVTTSNGGSTDVATVMVVFDAATVTFEAGHAPPPPPPPPPPVVPESPSAIDLPLAAGVVGGAGLLVRRHLRRGPGEGGIDPDQPEGPALTAGSDAAGPEATTGGAGDEPGGSPAPV